MAKKDISLGSLKRYLKHVSREQLADEISDLFTKFESVRDYYHTKLLPEGETTVIEKYKDIIKNEFFPARGFGKARLSVAKKAVSNYKIVCRTKTSLADIMLYYVENGVEYTSTYGDIDEAFYYSLESMYKRAVELIVENELQEGFQERCQEIVDSAANIGWGFYDALGDMYDAYFEE